MVTQNYFVMPATVLEKFRSRGFPEGVTLTADHCNMISAPCPRANGNYAAPQGTLCSGGIMCPSGRIISIVPLEGPIIFTENVPHISRAGIW